MYELILKSALLIKNCQKKKNTIFKNAKIIQLFCK